MKDRNEIPPSRVPLVAYCPEWSDNGFQICEFTGSRFVYGGQPNEDFDQYVEKWARVPYPGEDLKTARIVEVIEAMRDGATENGFNDHAEACDNVLQRLDEEALL